MDVTRRIEIDLPEDAADALDALVASGEFESASEVVLAGLESLEHADDTLTEAEAEYFRDAYRAYKANPSAVSSIEDVERRLEARLAH